MNFSFSNVIATLFAAALLSTVAAAPVSAQTSLGTDGIPAARSGETVSRPRAQHSAKRHARRARTQHRAARAAS